MRCALAASMNQPMCGPTIVPFCQQLRDLSVYELGIRVGKTPQEVNQSWETDVGLGRPYFLEVEFFTTSTG